MRQLKKILLITFMLAGFYASAQTTYSPTSTGNTTISKPMGANGFPVDARTYFYDAVNFKFRPYVSTTEVKTYLPTAANRTGITVIVNTGGTLLNGVITGGANAEWWFKDGTADGNLVLKTIPVTDTTSISNRINLKADKATTLTINSVAYDISANRSWTIPVTDTSSLNNRINNKADKTTTVNGHALSSNVTVSKSDVGLGNADNTSDINKPISTAAQAALDLKAALSGNNTFSGTNTFNGITVNGTNQTHLQKANASGGSAALIETVSPGGTITPVLNLQATENTNGHYNQYILSGVTPATLGSNSTISIAMPNHNIDWAGLDDITSDRQAAWFNALRVGTSTTTGYVLTGDASGNATFQAPTGAVSSLTTTGTSGAATLSSGVLNIPVYGGGSVTPVSGTTNRITSTGGTTPVIDISSTFEALLGKVANPLSQFASTTSSQLAGVISDETGSGALVFGTSPTLVTPALGTPSALVGTNITGTAAGLTAGNVTTNANLTGDVTSVGNATTIANSAVSNAKILNNTIDLTTKVNGLLPVANGGTGTASPGIVAGTNITVTGTWPNQTVNSSGGGGSFADNEIPSGTKNGTNVTFTLAHTPITGSVKLYLNTGREYPTDDFTVSGNTITMVVAPFTTDKLISDYRY